MLDWLACALVKTLGAVFCRLPPEAAVWVGERLGALAYWLQPKRTRIGVLNLRAAFDGQLSPRAARRIVHRCYQQLGAAVIELLRLPVIDAAYVARYITVQGEDRLEQAMASGRPVIFLTGHYGNWELASITAAFKGYPVVALARVQAKFPRLYRLLISYRESKGCTIVHKGGAMRRLIAALDQRRPVGIVGDQASRQGLSVEFFGRPALFATGPFALARKTGAIIVPFFTHRRRGPFHTIVVEPPMVMDAQAPEDQAIRQGMACFADGLARHIRDDPGQWLWMHKRWKHTPARRVLVLSDGKAGHLRQSLAAVDTISRQRAEVRVSVVEVRYRSALGRALTLLWSWWVPAGWGAARCLQWALTPASAAALCSRYADLVISSGSSAAAVNLLWAAENRAKAVVIMNPAPLPLRRFSLVIAPRHDRLPKRHNLLEVAGAITRIGDEDLGQASERLRAHPNFRHDAADRLHPAIGVFIGGDTPHYALDAAFADALIAQVSAACDALDGWSLVTTSRRTAAGVEQVLAERLGRAARCRLLLLAGRDPINGTMEGLLGSSDVQVVTGESISMVSEACASGRPVLVVEPPLRHPDRATRTKHRRFLQDLVQQGYVRLVPVAQLGAAIRQALQEPDQAKRLDTLTPVRDALVRLL